ncbi:NAD(P)/FAD-dependent oxidoreductase [Streptomyces sp. NPDC091272]|uniref:NAD(P)/FAD-dependent oxidoreductase n=1 Tax=Streptomyces sp. NPDC091272 TaxID=3365981 RepID=UPI0037F99EC6
MTERESVVGIVGSGIAGLRAADAILKRRADARIIIFGDENHRTYNRPGLTKNRYPTSTSSDMPIVEDLKIRRAENDALTWRLGTRVESADLRNKLLHLSSGETFAYGRLVIATGVRPRTSTAQTGRERECYTHRTLRDLDDARVIHHELQKNKKVTIMGAGFVACELASLAKEYGCDVVMLEALRRGPFESILGERISTALAHWLVKNGVTFLTGKAARDKLRDRSASQSLSIEAIGSVPNVEWLRGNGLDLSDGVRVDEYMRVPGYADVFAAGDIAQYPDPWALGSLTRREFWKNAIDTGDLAGRSVASSLNHDGKISPIEYFPNVTTEICGLRIQIAGNLNMSDSVEIMYGDLNQLDHGVLVRFLHKGTMVGVAYMDTGARFNSAYIKLLTSLKLRWREDRASAYSALAVRADWTT